MRHERILRLIELKYRSLAPLMDERVRRHWAAAQAQAYGWDGVSVVEGTSLHPCQGLMTAAPAALKGPMSRVATARPLAAAMAAM